MQSMLPRERWPQRCTQLIPATTRSTKTMRSRIRRGCVVLSLFALAEQDGVVMMATNAFVMVPPLVSRTGGGVGSHDRRTVSLGTVLYLSKPKDPRGSDDGEDKSKFIDLDAAMKELRRQQEEEEQFSNWIEGLGQWPRKPKRDANEETVKLETTGIGSASSSRSSSSSTDNTKEQSPNKDIFDTISETFKVIESTELRKQKRKDSQPLKDPFLSLPPLPLQQPPPPLLIGPPGRPPAVFRGRMNPLSNFIQLEAILVLAAGVVNNETEPYFNSVFAAADQIFKLSKEQQQQPTSSLEDERTGSEPTQALQSLRDEAMTGGSMDWSNVTTVEELIQQEQDFLGSGSLPFSLDKLWAIGGSSSGKSVKPTKETSTFLDLEPISPSAVNATSASIAQTAEAILKDTTARIEDLVSDASAASTFLSPNNVQELIGRASRVFGGGTAAGASNATTEAVVPSTPSQLEVVTNEIVRAAQRVARERGLDVQFAADRAREATNYAAAMATVANVVLGSGYAYGSRSGASGIEGYPLYEVLPQVQQATTQPLFGAYETAKRIEPYQYENVVVKGAEMGMLAGAIYEDSLKRCHKLRHSLVANGTTANVAWMVTDSIDYESRYRDGNIGFDASSLMHGEDPMFVRHITIRGFDASDDTVDREALLNDICTASPVPLNDETADKVLFHTGLLSIAKELYADINKYIEWTSPRHKIVLNGHSVGGSLAILVLLLIASERGVDFVRQRIVRVFSHGSPPVATVVDPVALSGIQPHICPILDAFGLSSDLVYGFVQPYDPVVRLFTDVDALYPLVDDLGADEVTLYATGPRRSLRPIVRAIFASWEGWPRFRENWKGTNQQYQSVGTQHLLMPEPLRYLNDRFFSVNVGVPPTEAIVRVSSRELLPALNAAFPLDVFQVSLIPQAVRSFLHHFYPAYDTTIADYAAKVAKQARRQPEKRAAEDVTNRKISEYEPKQTNQKLNSVLAEANSVKNAKRRRR